MLTYLSSIFSPFFMLLKQYKKGPSPYRSGPHQRLLIFAQLRHGRLSGHLLGTSQKSRAFPGTLPFLILGRNQSALRQENSRPAAGNFAWTRLRRGSLSFARGLAVTPSALTASPWPPWRPFARPLFCCGPRRSPQALRSGPRPQKSAWRGRDPESQPAGT